MDEAIKLYADFEDGKLIIERQDGQPISIFTHEEQTDEVLEVLEFGCSGNTVKALQALLNAHGQHLEIDGIFGRCTQQSLLIFKDQNKLGASPVADLPVWEALIRREK